MSLQQESWTSRLASPEAVALRALGFLSSHVEPQQLLADTGLTRDDLKRRPLGAAQLLAVLDFLIAHEAMLLEFANAVDLPPEAAYEARRLFRQVASQEHGWPPYLSQTPSRPAPPIPA